MSVEPTTHPEYINRAFHDHSYKWTEEEILEFYRGPEPVYVTSYWRAEYDYDCSPQSAWLKSLEKKVAGERAERLAQQQAQESGPQEPALQPVPPVAPQSVAPQSVAPQSVAPQSVAPQPAASKQGALISFFRAAKKRGGIAVLSLGMGHLERSRYLLDDTDFEDVDSYIERLEDYVEWLKESRKSRVFLPAK